MIILLACAAIGITEPKHLFMGYEPYLLTFTLKGLLSYNTTIATLSQSFFSVTVTVTVRGLFVPTRLYDTIAYENIQIKIKANFAGTNLYSELVLWIQ